MLRSMTGYGRAEGNTNGLSITLELKSVNHRYFEFSARMPRSYSFLEDKIKNYLKNFISRGKIDVYVNIDTTDAENSVVKVNSDLAKEYMNAIKEIADACGIKSKIKLHELSRYPDVLTLSKEIQDEEAVWDAVSDLLQSACESFMEMRTVEGERLQQDLRVRAQTILEQVEFIEQRSPQTAKEYRKKLEERVRELLEDVQVDDQRLLTETAIFADKIAVSEETVRLRSHIQQMYNMMESAQPVGRKLDFLVQEMNREANTIGSKAQDIELAQRVVEIKSEIEKIREQVQNIE